MSTSAAPDLTEVPASDLYDPDEVLPKDSPLLEPYYPKTRPTPSPTPTVCSSVSPPPSPGNKRSSRRGKTEGFSHGEVLLISHLDGHRRDKAAYAEIESLASGPEEHADFQDYSDCGDSPGENLSGAGKDPDGLSVTREEASGIPKMSQGSADQDNMGAFDLKSLAAGALAAVADPQPVDAGPTPPVTENDVVGERPQAAPLHSPMAIATRRAETSRDERAVPAAMPSPYSPHSFYSSREHGATPQSLKLDPKSPTVNIPPSEGLPPIQLNSPRFETNGQTLPSIRAQLGDLHQLANNHAAENERMRHSSFPGSPPGTVPRLPSLHHTSPSMLPAEVYRDPISPSHRLASPGYYYSPTNGVPIHPEYARSSAESSSPDQVIATPTAPITDRMSIEGITNPQGIYVCKVPGCTALPFQTQYLLNSHANVHSSARPHYCPIKGCPRSEGGKGFKRKNEMIRHGLVHDSPGYVCPFCPDREHKYPRPDNLQR
jgi:hypothetical protein